MTAEQFCGEKIIVFSLIPRTSRIVVPESGLDFLKQLPAYDRWHTVLYHNICETVDPDIPVVFQHCAQTVFVKGVPS